MQQRLRIERGFIDEVHVRRIAADATTRADWQPRRRAAAAWVGVYRSATIEETKELELQGTFLHRIFVDVLGYVDFGSGSSHWTLKAEPTTDVNARRPDGSLGFFSTGAEASTRVVIELKDATTDLDAKQMGRADRLSPVEQAFLYMSLYEDTQFAIVSNFVTLRLYSKRFGVTRHHEFDLTTLADPEQLSVFVGLCASETLLGDSPTIDPPIAGLLSDRLPRRQSDITDRFYNLYANTRNDLVGWLVDRYPNRRAEIIEKTQKLLDRLIFIAFAEDTGLLPREIIRRTIEHGEASRSRSTTRIWTEFKYLFEDIDRGRTDIIPPINRYNGGLFAHDSFLDFEAQLEDAWVREFARFAEFDFRSEVDVNILGNIFERSIADIELLRRQLSLFSDSASEVDVSALDQQRRDYGVYYTPSWVTHFIVDQTLGRILQLNGGQDREGILVCDPSCGSGAFLSEAISYLDNYSRGLLTERLARGETDLFEQREIQRAADYLPQIYGVDLLAESVEITKLALWLKTVAVTEPLDAIDTICQANSLTPQSDAASLWQTRVGEIAREHRFQVVIGNPPWGAEIDYPLDEFELRAGQYDSYELFLERSLRDLVAPDGYFGFIVPDRLLRPEGERVRRWLFDGYSVVAVLKVGEGVFPGVFRSSAILIVHNSPPSLMDAYIGAIVVKQDREELERSGTSQLTSVVERRGGMVSRSRVVEDDHYDIALFPDVDLEVSDHMRAGASPWIGDNGIFAVYGRGEELGTESFVVQCPSCFEWAIGPRRRAQHRGGGFKPKVCSRCGATFSVEQALSQEVLLTERYDPDDPAFVPIYSGEAVNRYVLGKPMGLRVGARGVSLKDESLYASGKILIRQVSVGIYAAVDPTPTRCMQSVYAYSVNPDFDVQPEYYLAQLCSRAMLYYYFILTNQVEWQSFPKLTHATLQRLPLMRPDMTDAPQRRRHDDLVLLVQRRAQHRRAGEDGQVSGEALEAELEIESIVMDIFGLAPDERVRINDRLRASGSNIRIIREMFPSDASFGLGR
jgi:type I restriction-modification system DNA methylase subunit